MTNEQILKKAIKKAVENGYRSKGQLKVLPCGWYKSMAKNKTYNFIIFSHDFAKAFWGDDLVIYSRNWWMKKKDYYNKTGYKARGKAQLPAWQYHLQMMVLEKEPLLYLGKFLEE